VVPVISIFFGIVIRMFYREHGVPHERVSPWQESRRWTEEAFMEFLPMVIQAEYRGGFKIRVVFNDGVAETIDFSEWLVGPIFEPLKHPAYFASFFIDGGTIAWPNGADIAPETLYERAKSSQAA
jgi:uncharacterized protein DUF2442